MMVGRYYNTRTFAPDPRGLVIYSGQAKVLNTCFALAFSIQETSQRDDRTYRRAD